MANDIEKAAPIVAAVGAINWGLAEFANLNLVTKIAEFVPATIPTAKILYGVIAAAGVMLLMKGMK